MDIENFNLQEKQNELNRYNMKIYACITGTAALSFVAGVVYSRDYESLVPYVASTGTLISIGFITGIVSANRSHIRNEIREYYKMTSRQS